MPNAGIANGPLAGLRVLDLSHVLAGPYAAYHLALLGADVVKIEKPPAGDAIRDLETRPAQGGVTAAFQGVNAGKRAIALDLARPEGRAVLARLIPTAAVFLENFRPGKMAGLGFGPEKVAALDAPLEHVPYRTSAAGLADLMAGRVQLTLDAASVTLPAILDGRLRALVWNGPSRNPQLPNVPTLAEAIPGLELANPWLGLLAPRGVPAPLPALLETELAAALATPGLAARLGDGLELLGGGAEVFARQLRADHARFGALIAKLDIQSD